MSQHYNLGNSLSYNILSKVFEKFTITTLTLFNIANAFQTKIIKFK